MAKITKDEVLRIANIARLELDDEEANYYTEKLEGFLQMAEKLHELDTEQVEITIHGIQLVNVMREDVPKQEISRDDVLKQAPSHEGGHIKVPTILE